MNAASSTPARRDRLARVLDLLLPGEGNGWPAAGALGLADELIGLAARLPEGATVLGLVDTLPEPIDEQTFAATERHQPQAFGALFALAVHVYYADPRVRLVVEARTGFPARPPQPLGYAVEQFDPELLAVQRRRAPFWRSADDV